MAITDELRKWAQICGIKYDSKLYEIADNIDAAHRAALEKLAAQVDESEDGWVRLPVDADGVPIRVGDVVEWVDEPNVSRVVSSIQLAEDGWWVYVGGTGRRPDKYRHHHEPTVEDVLREFAREIDADAYGITDAKVAEFAARLRLAGEGE